MNFSKHSFRRFPSITQECIGCSSQNEFPEPSAFLAFETFRVSETCVSSVTVLKRIDVVVVEIPAVFILEVLGSGSINLCVLFVTHGSTSMTPELSESKQLILTNHIYKWCCYTSGIILQKMSVAALVERVMWVLLTRGKIPSG